MKNDRSWDDIPSLDGVEVDWNYKPQTDIDQRSSARLDMGSITQLASLRQILVKLATAKQTFDGTLVDISEGGLALKLPVALAVDLPVRVGLYLAQMKIISRGLVRYSKKDAEHYITGVKFIEVDTEAAKFIRELNAAKYLHRTL